MTDGGGGCCVETHNCRPYCSCDSDRLRRGLHGIITFGMTGPLPPEKHSTQTVPLSPCAVWNFQVKGTSSSLTCIGGGWPGRRLGQASEKGDMLPPLFTDHVSRHGSGLHRMHRQPCLQLVCAFDFRGPGKLNSSSHDAARISHARRRVDEAPGAPSRARTAVTAARCVGGSRCSACVAVARFLFLLSFFSHFRSPPSSDPGVGGRCAMSRAAVSREREGHLSARLAHLPPSQSPHRESNAVPSNRARGSSWRGASSYCPLCWPAHQGVPRDQV